MAERTVLYTEDSARRINNVVRLVEGPDGVKNQIPLKRGIMHFELVEDAGTTSNDYVLAKISTVDGVDELIASAKVYHLNGELDSQLTGFEGQCVPFGEDFYVIAGIQNAIIDLRLSGNNLQYTKDGTTWVTWHAAGECPS